MPTDKPVPVPETRPGKVNKRQVKDAAVFETGTLVATETIAQAVTHMAPIADAAITAAMDASGQDLVASATDEPITAIAGRAVLFLGLRVGNKYLRDETGSTKWVWVWLGRKGASLFRHLARGLFGLCKFAGQLVFRRR